jgi:hypothetical protein
MTAATFQTEIINQTYNGWANYETWNVSLWIQNDEGLYNLARTLSDYKELVDVLYNEYGVTETKDGVKFNSPKINRIELDDMMADIGANL